MPVNVVRHPRKLIVSSNLSKHKLKAAVFLGVLFGDRCGVWGIGAGRLFSPTATDIKAWGASTGRARLSPPRLRGFPKGK